MKRKAEDSEDDKESAKNKIKREISDDDAEEAATLTEGEKRM